MQFWRKAAARASGQWLQLGAALWLAAFVGALGVPAPFALAANVQNAGSTEEAALNGFGDPWSLAKPNPSIALAGATGCYRKPAEGMSYAFSEAELQFHETLATPFVIEGCAVIIETDPPVVNDRPGGDTAALKERVKQFKESNPSEKYIGYFDFSKWESTPIGYKDVLKEHTGWFVYADGASKDDLKNRVQLRRGGYLLDVTNPEYQDFISQKIAEGLSYYGMDGLLADNIHAAPVLKEGAALPGDIAENWGQGEVAILQKIKEKIGGDKYLFANVGRDEKAPFKKSVLAAVDGVMAEDGFSPIAKPLDPSKGRLAGTLRLYDMAAKAGKYVIVTANTLVDGSKFDTTSSEREHAFARYYLAAHLIFRQGNVLLLYNPPSALQPQYGAEAFFSDWNINVGEPKGAYEELAAGVYERAFANSVVYLNTTEEPYPITAPAGFDLAPDKTQVSEFNLPPKSGFILSRPEALQ